MGTLLAPSLTVDRQSDQLEQLEERVHGGHGRPLGVASAHAGIQHPCRQLSRFPAFEFAVQPRWTVGDKHTLLEERVPTVVNRQRPMSIV
jgi:hypothetical protein